MAPQKNKNSNSQGEGRSPASDSKQGGKDEVYRKRRERNNIAVRKSRQLSRQKAKMTDQKVDQLREENKQLEERVKLLNKELGVLRDLFLSSGAAVPDNQGTASMQNENV